MKKLNRVKRLVEDFKSQWEDNDNNPGRFVKSGLKTMLTSKAHKTMGGTKYNEVAVERIENQINEISDCIEEILLEEEYSRL
jgi:hypothetical protein